MLKSKITRRQFLKGSVALTAAATALSFLELNSKKLNAAELYEPGWNVEWRPNMCAFCANICGEWIRIHSKNGKKRPLKLEGNKNDNYNQGKLCARGQSGLKYLFNPDRITEPLIRIEGSKRGEWKFRKATWEEAAQYIAQKMQGVTPGEIAFLGGWHGCAQYKPLIFPELITFQTLNIWAAPIQNCVGMEHLGIHVTFGYFVAHGEMVADFEHANFILAVRSNASLVGISTGRANKFARGMKNGAEFYVVDVRHSEAAAKATKWLKIKPGTDLAFALAMLHVILHEKYYGKNLYEHNINFLKYHTNAPFLLIKMKHPVTKQDTWWHLADKVDKDGNPSPMGLWYKHFYVWDNARNTIAQLDGYSNHNKTDSQGNRIEPAMELPEEVRKGILEELRKKNPYIEDVKTVWELLKEKTKPYTPEWASQITGLPAEDIRETAIKFATKRPSVVVPGIYDARYANTIQLRKTLSLMQAIINGHDNLGGYIVGGTLRKKIADMWEWLNKEGFKKIGGRYIRFPMGYPVDKALYPAMKVPGILWMLDIFFGLAMPYAQDPKAVMAYIQKGDYTQLAKTAFGYPTIEVTKSLQQWLKFMQNPRKEKPGVAFPGFGDYGWDDAFEGKLLYDGKPLKPKAIWVYAANPVLGSPYADKWKKWMQDAKVVVFVDTMPSDSNAYADVILPDKTFLERDEIIDLENSHTLAYIKRSPATDKVKGHHAVDIFFFFAAGMIGEYIAKQKGIKDRNQAFMEGVKVVARNFALMNGIPYEKVMEKLGKALQEVGPWDAFTRAAKELTVEEIAEETGKTPKEVEQILEKEGVYNITPLEELLEKWAIPEKIPTSLPSGRVELFATIFELAQSFFGYLPNWDPACAYVEINRKPEGGDYEELPTGEFFVSHGKAPIFSHTGTHTLDNPLLVAISEWKKLPDIYYRVWMNPKSAAKLGIKDGDLIEVVNKKDPSRKMKAYVYLTKWVREDTIFIPFNGGTEAPHLRYAIRPPKAARYIDFVHYEVEPVIAGYTKDETTVEVRKVS